MKKNGNPMQDAREKQSLSVDDVARLAGVSYWQALRTLNGQSTKLSVVKKICDALGLDPAFIFEKGEE